jgi:hypothetical protein
VRRVVTYFDREQAMLALEEARATPTAD